MFDIGYFITHSLCASLNECVLVPFLRSVQTPAVLLQNILSCCSTQLCSHTVESEEDNAALTCS